MAWTTPRDWVAAAVVTAAQMNAHVRDNLKALLPLDQVAWTTYTPTFSQSATITKTVTRAKYQQIGKIVFFDVTLTATSAGTAANAVLVGLPVTAAAAVGSGQHAGSGRIFDTSVAGTCPGLTIIASTTTCALVDSASAQTGNPLLLGQTGTSFAAAIGSGDVVYACGFYEAA